MNYYLDFRLRPDPEFGPEQLMSALFSKLHRALAEDHSHGIGISFPEENSKRPALGACLRLHGNEHALQALMEKTWLNGMRDHFRRGEIQAIPEKVSHRIVSRVQAKSSPERLRRRLMRRHGLNEIDALERIPDTAMERLDLPYVSIRSQSTNQMFRIFVAHGDLLESPRMGKFSDYGLSVDATVPWF